MKRPNVDQATVAGFGTEWKTFDQLQLAEREHQELFDEYFRGFPWFDLPTEPRGADIGCGSGRWARLVAPRVGQLICVDASPDALDVARTALSDHDNCTFELASVGDLPIPEASLDFAYSLGVLHHVPDTAAAIASCARVLKPGAPFLVYLYYAFDQRPRWFRALWRISDRLRLSLSRRGHRSKLAVSTVVAVLVYFPLARAGAAAERYGKSPEGIPLSYYRHRSLYTMRTDAYDRLSTQLEQRFTHGQIEEMLNNAGLVDVSFSDQAPFWCAVAYRAR